MAVGDEVELQADEGRSFIVKLVSKGEPDANGLREVSGSMRKAQGLRGGGRRAPASVPLPFPPLPLPEHARKTARTSPLHTHPIPSHIPSLTPRYSLPPV
jgi:hypothetical protein